MANAKIDPKKQLETIRRRNADVYDTSRPDIEKNTFRAVGMGVYREQKFLLSLVDAFLRGENPLEPAPAEEPAAEDQ